MLNVGINLWRTSITHGGAIAPDFPPNVSGTQATIAADFVGNQYWAAGASKASFAAWMTAIGGTYTRSSSATYLQGGVVKTATANTPRFPTSLGGVAQGLRLTGAATNVQTQSADFSQAAAWVTSFSTQTTGQSDPAGGATATKIIPNTGGIANPGVNSNLSPGFTSTSWTVSMFAKNAGYNFLIIDINNFDAQQACFDLTTGAVTTLGTVTAGSIALANGWWLCYLTCVPVQLGNWPPSFRVSDHQGSGTISFTGDGVSGVSMWGGQITNTAFPVDYIPTTTVSVTQAADSLSFPYTQTTFSALAGTNDQHFDGSAAQRVIGIGTDAPIFINAATQFAIFAGAFAVGPTITNVINPHKTMVAGNPANCWLTSDGLVPVTSAGSITTSTPVTMVIGSQTGATNYAGGNYSQLAIWNGIVASTAEMQRLTAPPPPTIANASINADFAGNTYAVAGASKANFAAWLAAIGGTYSRSSSATYLQGGVVKTATANTLRFPTDLGGTPQGIRLTGTGTNIHLHSSISDSVASYTTVGGDVLTANAAIDPSGGSAAASLLLATTTQHYLFLAAGVSPANGVTYTYSAYIKPFGPNTYQIELDATNAGTYYSRFDFTGNGSVPFTFTGVGTIQKLANGWFRITQTCVGGGINVLPVIYPYNGGRIFAGDGVSGFYIWGEQFEASPFATDYIPTTTATVTQAADALSFPFTQTTFSVLAGTNSLLSDHTGTQRELDANGDGFIINGNTQFAMIIAAGLFGATSSLVIANPNKTMVAGNPTTGAITSNGVAPSFGAGAITSATPTAMFLGSQGGTANFMNGNFSQFTIWNGLMASAADMQRLTT
jgi:hypothetical protein